MGARAHMHTRKLSLDTVPESTASNGSMPWAPSTGNGLCPCSKARDKVEFPWRKLQKREEAELESHGISVFGALFAAKSDHRKLNSWKICCNHYLCSLFIMHLK